jgi:hypothetical protein
MDPMERRGAVARFLLIVAVRKVLDWEDSGAGQARADEKGGVRIHGYEFEEFAAVRQLRALGVLCSGGHQQRVS